MAKNEQTATGSANVLIRSILYAKVFTG